MIAAIRSGIGSLVDQWFGESRINDRQGSRTQPLTAGSDDSTHAPGAHADMAMRRFMAYTLDASLDDLRNEASPSELAGLEPVTRVLGDLELQAKYLPRRPSLL